MVSWKTNGGPVVGAVAFASDGTLFAAIGAGQTTGDGKANAIVALDPKTLQLKDWFTQPAAEFVTGPTILRHADKEIVAAATKDGRVLLLDAKSLGGTDHATPLHASKTWLGPGATVSADALATWQQSSAARGADGDDVLDSAAGRRPAGERRAVRERRDLGWRRDRPEADRRRRRALAGAGMGLARPLGARPRRSRSTAWCSRWRPECRRHRRAEARRPCSTPTTARRASGSGAAARR